MVQSERFGRLLRWYPRRCRERNGDVLLGTMLDQAEQDGRVTPSVTDHATAAVYGLGARLGAGLALWCALLALLAAAVTGVLATWAAGTLAASGAGWVLPVLAVGVCPLLVSVGTVALLQERGIISEPRALALLPAVTLALMLAALAGIAWREGFEAADAGAQMSALAAAWSWLVVTAWAIGAAAIAALLDGVLQRTRVHHALSILLAVVTGLLAAPLVGLSLIAPYTSAIAAAVLGVAVLVTRRNAGATEHPAQESAPILSRRSRDLARMLAAATATVSTVGVVYALTGSLWFPDGPDATIAMAHGITVSLLGALPLLAGIGLLAVTRSRHRPVHTWVPLLLVALSLGGVAVAYQSAPDWDRMAPGFLAASVLSGAAIAWWSATRLPGSATARVAIGVLIGVACGAFLSALIMPMLAFAIPLLALALAIWTPGASSRGSRSSNVDGRIATPLDHLATS